MARILIVDDEPLITAMMEEWLSELGHAVVGPAHSLARALELAESSLDAAIVDASLGKDNSYPLLEALTARGLPFALATGHGEDGIEPKYRGRPTLRKPFEFAALGPIIDELIAQSAGARKMRGRAALSQRCVNCVQRLRPWAQFALGEPV
jgi:CheY-like chemotaxis protein